MQEFSTFLQGKNASESTLIRLRSQAYIVVISTLLCLCCISLGLYLFFNRNQDTGLHVIPIALGLFIILYASSLISIYFTGFVETSGYFSILWTSLILLILMSTNRGAPLSSATPLIILPIGMAFCFYGHRIGLRLTGILLVCFTLIGIVNLSGYQFPYLIPDDAKNQNRTLSWTSCFIFITTIAVSYEWMIRKLLRERGGNYNELRKNYSSATLFNNPVKHALLVDFIDDAIHRAIQHGDKLALLSITFDSTRSDEQLQHYAEISKSLVRKVDTVIRTDKYKITIVLENFHNQDDIWLFMRKLQEKTGEGLDLEIQSALFPEHSKNSLDLIALCKAYDNTSSRLQAK